MPIGSPQTTFWKFDYDPSKEVIYTFMKIDITIFYQINITNGENINSKYMSASWPYFNHILFEENKLYVPIRWGNNERYLLIFYPETDRFENYRLDDEILALNQLRDPLTERYHLFNNL